MADEVVAHAFSHGSTFLIGHGAARRHETTHSPTRFLCAESNLRIACVIPR
jgi:hypothetical protein